MNISLTPADHLQKALKAFHCLLEGASIVEVSEVKIPLSKIDCHTLLTRIQQHLRDGGFLRGHDAIDYAALDIEKKYEPAKAEGKSHNWSETMGQLLLQLVEHNPHAYEKLCHLLSAKTAEDINSAIKIFKDPDAQIRRRKPIDFRVEMVPRKKMDFTLELERNGQKPSDFHERNEKIVAALTSLYVGKFPHLQALVAHAEYNSRLRTITIEGACPLLAECLLERQRTQPALTPH